MGEPFRIELLPAAEREIDKLPRDARRRIADPIDALAADPRPADAKLLAGTGRERIWRLRVGQYRVLYLVEDGRLRILVVRIADRREAYGQPAIRRLLANLRRNR